MRTAHTLRDGATLSPLPKPCRGGSMPRSLVPWSPLNRLWISMSLMSSPYLTTPLLAQTPGPGKEVPPTPTLLLPFGSQCVTPSPPISTDSLLLAGTWWTLPTTSRSCGRDGIATSSLTHLQRSFTPGSLTMHSCTPHRASMMVGVISPECTCTNMLHCTMEPDPSIMLNSILRQSHHQWPHNSDAQPGLQLNVLHTNLC